MHLKCIQAGYIVTQRTTKRLLKSMDLHCKKRNENRNNYNKKCFFSSDCNIFLLPSFLFHFLIFSFSVAVEFRSLTLGNGDRSWAKCSSWTRGMTRRLGNTRKEAMASMIMLSDMTLRAKAEERYKNIHHVPCLSLTGCAVKHNQLLRFINDLFNCARSLQPRDIQ